MCALLPEAIQGHFNDTIKFQYSISSGYYYTGVVPGVPTSFGQEFSLKISKFRNGEKTCESLFTF